MTYHNRLPLGAIGDAPTEAPRYVPGRRVTPLNVSPISEADTWPSVPAAPLEPLRVIWRPHAGWRRHSWLYWRLYEARWAVADALDWMCYETGWIGQTVILVLCAVGLLALAAALVLSSLWLGLGMGL